LKSERFASKSLFYAIHILLAFIVIFPILFALSSSFRPLDDVFRYVSPVSWKTFVPTNWTWDAYYALFAERGFGRVFFNTFFVAIVNVVVGVLVNAMAGFAFAKLQFPAKNLLFAFVLLTFMIPFEVIAIPLYSLVDDLNWLDSYYGLIVPGIANGLVIFLYRQFFTDLPNALLEAAWIDGASWTRIFTSVALPLCKPVTISAGLLIFISQWESFMWPLLVSRSEAYRVIQVALSYFVTEHATYWNEMFAASILAIVIPLCLLLPFQRYFVQGVSNTGSKE
jgi:multiple sugar transport system permease protein/putative chitobiose transport system permease protein